MNNTPPTHTHKLFQKIKHAVGVWRVSVMDTEAGALPPTPTSSLCHTHTHTKEYVGLQSGAEESGGECRYLCG